MNIELTNEFNTVCARCGNKTPQCRCEPIDTINISTEQKLEVIKTAAEAVLIHIEQGGQTTSEILKAKDTLRALINKL